MRRISLAMALGLALSQAAVAGDPDVTLLTASRIHTMDSAQPIVQAMA